MGEGSPDGAFDLSEVITSDLAYCLNLSLGDAASCVPVPPTNDECDQATVIEEEGPFSFTNTTATTDGITPDSCQPSVDLQIDRDVWYCWTSPCTDRVFVSTCGQTELDTMIAVYEGCDICPPTNAGLVACNDDLCGELNAPQQSMVIFDA